MQTPAHKSAPVTGVELTNHVATDTDKVSQAAGPESAPGTKRTGRDPADESLAPAFQWSWLAPSFWPFWLLLGVWVPVALGPWRIRRALGGMLGKLLYRLQDKRRRYVQINLAWCFPELSDSQRDELGLRFARLFGRTVLDYGVLWWGSRRRLEKMLRVHGTEHIDTALASGRRVILFTPHTVALDFGAAALTMRYPMVGPAKKWVNPLVDWMFARGRSRFGGRVISTTEGTRKLVKYVRAGELMYYLPDEDKGRSQKSVFVPFFGKPIATMTAFPRLVRMCDAVAIPVMSYYDETSGCYDVRVLPALEGFPSGNDIRDAAHQRGAIEGMIRVDPAQYMWSMSIFKTRPGGEMSPYDAIRATQKTARELRRQSRNS